ncbi:hypothetical protein SeMB42_g00164 [Synchytrium endobioticum]|uniref:Uncharacterized protein n=1 Tax=Synchytrium endobioticum TaxID=286115 RepID=A0A507DSD6_9FUNG|nr:hypothetical protein SeMB42_g00164 [Synchytrium endobioticum]
MLTRGDASESGELPLNQHPLNALVVVTVDKLLAQPQLGHFFNMKYSSTPTIRRPRDDTPLTKHLRNAGCLLFLFSISPVPKATTTLRPSSTFRPMVQSTISSILLITMPHSPLDAFFASHSILRYNLICGTEFRQWNRLPSTELDRYIIFHISISDKSLIARYHESDAIIDPKSWTLPRVSSKATIDISLTLRNNGLKPRFGQYLLQILLVLHCDVIT